MTLPVADINPPVKILPPVMLAALVIVEVADINPPVKILPPVMLAVADTNPPVSRLPPVMFAALVIVLVAEIKPPVKTLPPVTLPVADTNPPVFTLPGSTLPVRFKLVPVAAPMFGVVRLALALTMILPPPSNAVVMPSVLAENTVPVKLRPAAVLAV